MKTNPNLIAAYQKAMVATGSDAAVAGMNAADKLRSAGSTAMNSRSAQLVSSMPGTGSLMPTLASSLAKQITAVPVVKNVSKTTGTAANASKKSATGKTGSATSGSFIATKNVLNGDEIRAARLKLAAQKETSVQEKPLGNAGTQTQKAVHQTSVPSTGYAAAAGSVKNTSGTPASSYAPGAALAETRAKQARAVQQRRESNQNSASLAQITAAVESDNLDLTVPQNRKAVAGAAQTFLSVASNKDAYAAVVDAMQDKTGKKMAELEKSGYYGIDALNEAENLYYLNQYAGLGVENVYGDRQRDMDVYRNYIGNYLIGYNNLSADTSYDTLDSNSKTILAQYDAAKRSSTYELSSTPEWNEGQKQAAYEYVQDWKNTASVDEKSALVHLNDHESEEALREQGFSDDAIRSAKNVYALAHHSGYSTTAANNKIIGTAASDIQNMAAGAAAIMDTGAGALGMDEALNNALGTESFTKYAQQLGQNVDLMAQQANLGAVGNLSNSIAENLILGSLGGSALSSGLSLQGAGEQAKQNYAAGDSDVSNLLSTLASYGYNYILNDALNPIANNIGATNTFGNAVLEGSVDNAVQDLGTGIMDNWNNAALDIANNHTGAQKQASNLLDPEFWNQRVQGAAMAGLSGGILGGLSSGMNMLNGTAPQNAAPQTETGALDAIAPQTGNLTTAPNIAQNEAQTASAGYDAAINYRDSLLDTGYHTESAPYGGNTVGAAQAGETYVSQAADNTVANSATVKNDSALGEAVQQMRAAGAFDVQSVSEARSIRNAENMLQTDKAAETQRLSQQGVDLSEGAQDFDETMMLIADKSVDNATRRTLLKNVVEAWHKAGQALQSAAKYTRTASSTLAKAQQIMQENAEDWASRNGGEQKHIEAFSQNLSEALADRTDLYNSLGQMRETINRMIRESDLSQKAKAQFTAKKVGEMAKIIMNGKDTMDSKSLTLMLDTFFNSGLFELSDSAIDTVMEAYAEAEQYDPNSKAYADAEKKAYTAIADGVTQSTWGEKVRAWRYLSMLSSPRTSIKNAGGNIGMGALTATKDAVKAVLEKAYNATPAGKKNPLRSAALFVSQADKAAAYADTDAHVYAPLTQNQRYEGAAGIQRGVESNKSIFDNTALENARRMNSASLEGQDVYGSLGFLTAASDLRGDGALTQKAREFSQSAEANLQKLGENGIIGLGGLKNNYARAAAQYATANGESYAALTRLESDLRAGYENGGSVGLGELIHDAMDSEAAQLKVLAEARAYGVNEALKATFHDTNKIAQKLSQFEKGLLNSDSKLANGLGVFLEGTVPFKNTPANVLARGMEYSPVGLAKAMVDTAVAASGHGTKSGADIMDAWASGLTGSGLFALGMFAAASGFVNAGASGDDRKDYYDQNVSGQQTYSLNLPDGSTYTLDWTVPASLPFFVGAASYDAASSGDGGMSVSNLLDALSNISEPVLDTTMLSGLNSTLDTLKSDRNGALGSLGTLGLAAAGSYAGQFVPTVAKQIGRSFEDNRSSNYSGADAGAQRIVDKAVNKSTNWIPGMQDEIGIDQWGRPQENTGNNPLERLAYNLFSPGYYAQDNSTDVDYALQELYKDTGDSSVYPESGINDPTVTLDGENRRMTEQEMQDYSTVRGQTSYDLLDGIVGSDFWNGLSAADKAELVGDVYAYSNAYAHRETFGDDFRVPSSQEKNMEVYDQYGADALINRLEAAPALADASGGQEKAQAVAAMGLSSEDAAVTYAYACGQGSVAMQALDYGEDMAYYVMQANAAGIDGSSKAEDVQAWIAQQGFSRETARQLYGLLKKSAKNPY